MNKLIKIFNTTIVILTITIVYVYIYDKRKTYNNNILIDKYKLEENVVYAEKYSKKKPQEASTHLVLQVK